MLFAFAPKQAIKKLSLGDRIKEIKKLSNRESKYEDNIEAIKWIGNVGSHGTENVSSERIIQAYEILEFLLEELFLERNKYIQKITEEINQKKGK